MNIYKEKTNMVKFLKIIFFVIAIGITIVSVTLMIKGLPIQTQIIEKAIENDNL